MWPWYIIVTQPHWDCFTASQCVHQLGLDLYQIRSCFVGFRDFRFDLVEAAGYEQLPCNCKHSTLGKGHQHLGLQSSPWSSPESTVQVLKHPEADSSISTSHLVNKQPLLLTTTSSRVQYWLLYEIWLYLTVKLYNVQNISVCIHG